MLLIFVCPKFNVKLNNKTKFSGVAWIGVGNLCVGQQNHPAPAGTDLAIIQPLPGGHLRDISFWKLFYGANNVCTSVFSFLGQLPKIENQRGSQKFEITIFTKIDPLKSISKNPHFCSLIRGPFVISASHNFCAQPERRNLGGGYLQFL